MADISKLEEQESFADEYGDRIAEWELLAVALVCKELGRIGKMTPEQAKKYDTEKETKKTEKIILSALTTAVLLNIKDLPKTYTNLFDEWHKGNVNNAEMVIVGFQNSDVILKYLKTDKVFSYGLEALKRCNIMILE